MTAEADVVALCARLRPRLVGTLSLYCGDRWVAEELAQETLARVWDRWSQVSQTASPEAWAHRVAINLANSHFRRRAAERRARARAGSGSEPVEAGTADAIAVRDAVSALPPRQRSALVLRYFADLTVADTAALMGCAQGTVKSLTSQALAALRVHLDEPLELHDVS